MEQKNGVLYVVATPIGHLKDLSLRAIEVLSAVDLIAAEDTRHSRTLLSHYGIKTRAISLHDHNESAVVPKMVQELHAGRSVALISDAGTPLISDPGFALVRAVAAEGLQVVTVPGACALIAALSIAGLPTDRFVFEGFLAAKSGERRAALQQLAAERRTLIFYESCHRITTTLTDMAAVWGGARQIVVARELTKLYEEVIRGSLDDVVARIAAEERFRKGEYVLVVAGAPAPEQASELLAADNMLRILLQELPLKQATKLAASLSGLNKNQLYERALAIVAEEAR
ncbi:MAG: 16S rRNA (cytidine1402-2'-O)-methyltransferase [Halothiobacillaceae bacterium]|nr:MAG: 16S rRNA (cytidine1402-2'-O)-methyltransferase [Halothiobacillaceae bacterium]